MCAAWRSHAASGLPDWDMHRLFAYFTGPDNKLNFIYTNSRTVGVAFDGGLVVAISQPALSQPPTKLLGAAVQGWRLLSEVVYACHGYGFGRLSDTGMPLVGRCLPVPIQLQPASPMACGQQLQAVQNTLEQLLIPR